MSSVENRLIAIGYRVSARGPDCWRVERIGTALASPAGHRTAPPCSRALRPWLERLHDRPQPAVYRVRPMPEVP